jgi:type 1 glutamine amidotransferase
MITMRRLLILSVLLAVSNANAPAAAAEVAKIKVLIIDGQNNHNWRQTTPILKHSLEQSGKFTVDVSSNLKEGDKPGNIKETVPFPPDLGSYQVVISNYNGAPWPAAFRQSLGTHVKEGKLGLVVFHGANNPFADWKEFNLMIGMGWRGNKFGDRIYLDADGKTVRQTKGEGVGAGETSIQPFRVTVRDTDHPVTKGMPREWMHAPDQLVHGLRGPIENVHVLATAWSDKAKRGTGEHEPMIWTVAYGKGRVFHTPMGHDGTSVRCVGFVTILLRGTEWAATEKVTVPIPQTFPSNDKPSLLTEK